MIAQVPNVFSCFLFLFYINTCHGFIVLSLLSSACSDLRNVPAALQVFVAASMDLSAL